MKVLFNAGVRLAGDYDAFAIPQAIEIPSGCFSSATSCLSYAELSCLGNIGQQSLAEIHRLSSSLDLCLHLFSSHSVLRLDQLIYLCTHVLKIGCDYFFPEDLETMNLGICCLITSDFCHSIFTIH